MSNSGLNAAKAKKYDEFYTRRQDIEAELRFYRDEFAGKTVYCNCDDPWESEFVQYFCRNFRELGLRKLMATHYEPNKENHSYSISIQPGKPVNPQHANKTISFGFNNPAVRRNFLRRTLCGEEGKYADQ